MGPNIRTGSHYTQFLFYDFNGDGRAEMICKTASGSIDGVGQYVTEAADDEVIKTADNTADYRNSQGRILSGPEYLTVFDGLSGRALHTIWYSPYRTLLEGKTEKFIGVPNGFTFSYDKATMNFRLEGTPEKTGLYQIILRTSGARCASKIPWKRNLYPQRKKIQILISAIKKTAVS
ncbi:MAG: hypothetical protein IJV34_08215 [Prevotella sp.]|nr:hypothetical protein [Prevotella sp.]